MNKTTWPDFVLCPCKIHPKGNEYHTICCDESGIIYAWGIDEVRGSPITTGGPEFDKNLNMKMVGIMIWLKRAI